jgi:hypothetical protein
MSDPLALAPKTEVLNKAGWAVGTTTTLSFTANPLQYKVKGRCFTKATVTNGAPPATDILTGAAFVGIPINKCAVFALGYDAAGTLRVAQSELQSMDVSAAPIVLPQLPSLPDTVCPTGYVLVKVGATGATWTLGSSNFSGPPTGVVFVFVDGDFLDRPFAA